MTYKEIKNKLITKLENHKKLRAILSFLFDLFSMSFIFGYAFFIGFNVCSEYYSIEYDFSVWFLILNGMSCFLIFYIFILAFIIGIKKILFWLSD